MVGRATMTTKYRLVGTNDDEHSCCCCGRVDLKRVMWLVPMDADGNPQGKAEHYGTSCAARMLGWSYPSTAGTKRRVEVEAAKAAEATIQSTLEAIRREKCVIVVSETPCGRYFILALDLVAYTTGTKTLQECLDATRSAFPLLSYYDGKLTRDQALRYALQEVNHV